MSITCTINSVSMTVLWPINVDRRINLRSTMSLTVSDPTNTLSILEDMPVVVSDSVRGTLFTGYVQSVDAEKLPGATMIFKTITCKNLRWLADKRYFLGPDYVNAKLAGDIVCDLHASALSSEGILANYVQDHDFDSTTWGTGVHTGTSGASGELTLAKAGTSFTVSENTDAEWASCTTLGSTSYNNDALILSQGWALKYTGSCAAGLQSNTYNYRVIWSGSYTIQAGDRLTYAIFMSSTSPDFMGQVDMGFSDGTYFRDKGYTDNLGISCRGSAVLSQYATDQWYYRDIPLTPTTNPLTGMVVNTAMVSLEGDKEGTYTYYFQDIKIVSSVGAVRVQFYLDHNLPKNYQVSNIGYYNTNLRIVPIYADSGTRISSAYDISSPASAGRSLLSWTEINAVQAPASSNAGKRPQVLIETSVDSGASYQVCTNHQPITGILAGMTLTGKTLLIRETLTLGGSSPEVTPRLTNVTATIQSSYAATKSDASLNTQTTANWATGSLTNVTAANNQLQLSGYFENWDDGTTGSANKYTTDGSATMSNTQGSLTIRCAPLNDIHVLLSSSPTMTDFVAEFDTRVPDDPNGQSGMLYHTTYWGNTNNTWGYYCFIFQNGIGLGYGSNSAGGGSWTLLQANNFALTAGDWHHVQVNVTANVHTVYLNGVSMFSGFDNTYPTGQFGLRYWNGSTTTRFSGWFDNFGVQSYLAQGNRVSPSLSLNAVGTVRDSIINWTEETAGNTSVLVETSINGGATYSTCTNGAQIPGLSSGVSVVGLGLLVRTTLNTQNYNYTPILTGLSALVVGQFNALANRVSVALDLTPVGVCGSTSVYWIENQPTNTDVYVETTIDNGAHWHTVANPGDPIYGIVQSPDPTIDDFTSNTSASYTQSGGTWTWDTTNSRLVATVGGKMVRTSLSYDDGAISAIMDYADGAGLTMRWTNSSNNYAAVFHDASASSANSCQLYKTVSGVTTQVGGSAGFSWTRGKFKKVTLSCVGTTIQILMDDVVLMTRTDNSLTTGKFGFEVDNRGQFYTAWISPQGQNLSGVSVKTRTNVISLDPLVFPTVPELTVSARSSNIDSGSSIASTAWAYQNTYGACIDDLSKRSNAWWTVRDDKNLLFQTRHATLAAWPVASVNSNDILAYSQPKVGYSTSAYRNKQYITGGKKVIAMHEQRLGDGIRQSWTLALPVAVNTVPVITIANAPQTVGLQSVGTFQMYYTENSITINQDVAQIPPEDQIIIDVTYQGVIDYTATAQNVPQQTLLASYDGSTGIVEAVENVTNLDSDAMDQLAQARINQFAILTRSWSFDTRRDGLLPGTICYLYVPEVSLNDVAMLITGVTETVTEEVGVVKTTYSVTCTEGPPMQDWQALFVLPT